LHGLDHRAGGRDDVVDQHRHPPAQPFDLGVGNLDLAIATPLLLEHDVGRAGEVGDGARPLRALAVGPDHDRRADVRPYPARHRGCCSHGDCLELVDLGELAMAVEVRIDGHEPVGEARQQACELGRGDGFSGMKASIRPHVRQIGHDQPDARRTERTRRRRGEGERQELVVGPVQVGEQRHVAPGDLGGEAYVARAIGKRAHRQRADLDPESVGERAFEPVLRRDGEEQPVHAPP